MTSLWRFAWWIFVLTLGLVPAASFIGFVGHRRSLRGDSVGIARPLAPLLESRNRLLLAPHPKLLMMISFF